MELSNNQTIGAGAGVGVLAGAGAGLAVGTKKASKLLSNAGIAKGVTQDTFVNQNLAHVMKTKSYRAANSAGKIKAKENVINVAKEKFTNAMQSAKNTKTKWIAGLAVAGAAIGTGIAVLVNKHKQDNAGVSCQAAECVAPAEPESPQDFEEV